MEAVLELRKASAGLAQAASYSGETLRMLTRGQLKFNMEMMGSEDLVNRMAKMINRLTLGVIIAGLFVGSSSFAQLNSDATVFGMPAVSFFGFLGAFILSVWVIFDIWRRR